jgi:hypothetical protein
MRILIDTNQGLFACHLTAAGNIVIYAGEDETPVAVIGTLIKRAAVADSSSEGVAKAVQVWLESNYDRLVTKSVTAQLTPPNGA